MRRYNHIQTITAVLATAALLLSGCSKDNLTNDGSTLSPAGMGELTLGELRLSDNEISPGTRAGTSGNLPEGATLRLYAFAEGETDFGSKLATRTYTINATGTAVLDPEQEPLFLPKGEADIYLVGPVEHNTGTQVAPVMEKVAAEWSITPRIGADLIATYAQATIVAGNTNPLPAMTLEHKMARTQIVVETNPNAVYENMVVQEVKLYGQPTTGTFTLDQTGGVITADERLLEDFVYPSVAKDHVAEKYSATTVLIPQAERELKVETTFECNQKNIEVDDNHPTLKYRQSGLVTAPLAAGTATRFSTQPITPVEIKWRTRVLPWNNVPGDDLVVPGPELEATYVVINGLAWAVGNLVADGANGAKIGKRGDYGLYFQHGSLVGWEGGVNGDGSGQGYPEGVVVKIKPTGYAGSVVWGSMGYINGDVAVGYNAATGQGDPCRYYLGYPWRLPTPAEFSTLFNNVATGTSWQNCATGAWFSSPVPGAWAGSGAKTADVKTAVFFPASGIRYRSSGGWWGANTNSFAWTSKSQKCLTFDSRSVSPNLSDNNRGGMPIRCVREGQ